MSQENEQEVETKKEEVPEFEIETNKPEVVEEKKEPEVKEEKKPNDSKEAGTENHSKKKNRSQKRIEALSREKRELQKELDSLKDTDKKVDEIDPESFENYDDYLDAVENQSKAPKEQKKDTKKSSHDDDFQIILDDIEVKFDDTRDKYDDFDEVVKRQPNEGGPTFTHSMIDALNSIDNSGEVAYFLGNDVKESVRISKLSPVKQIIEIQKHDNSIKKELNKKPVKKVTSAPDPINPLGAGETRKPTLGEARDYSEYEKMRTADNSSHNGW